MVEAMETFFIKDTCTGTGQERMGRDKTTLAQEVGFCLRFGWCLSVVIDLAMLEQIIFIWKIILYCWYDLQAESMKRIVTFPLRPTYVYVFMSAVSIKYSCFCRKRASIPAEQRLSQHAVTPAATVIWMVWRHFAWQSLQTAIGKAQCYTQ